MLGNTDPYRYSLLAHSVRQVIACTCVSASLLCVSAPIQAATWDCRMSADDGDWNCSQTSGPEEPATHPDLSAGEPVGQAPGPGPGKSTGAPSGNVQPDQQAAPTIRAPARELPADTLQQPAAADPTTTADNTSAQQALDPDQQQPAPSRPPATRSATTRPQEPVYTTPPAAEAIADPTPVATRISNGHASIDSGIDWSHCGSASDRASPDTSATPAMVENAGEVHITSDSLIAKYDPQKSTFTGNVRLTHGNDSIDADTVTFNRDSQQVDAQGDVRFQREDIRIQGSSAQYLLDSKKGHVENTAYRVAGIRARGTADRAELLGDGKSHYQNITYTTCRPGNTDWLINAEKLQLDHNEGLGTAHNAKLSVMDVPVLYLPRMTFPIDDRRRSGVLVPSIGHSSNNGVDITVPYYLNLAENYDLTLYPRVMSKRGFMLGAEFRYLTESSKGTLAGEVLPDDNEYKKGNSTRGSVSFINHTQLSARWEADLRLNYASDDDYFEDLGSSLAITSKTHLERAGEIRYHGDYWDFLGRVQEYQTLDDTIALTDRPYSRLPQLAVDLEMPDGFAGLTYHLNAEYVNFDRDNSVTGHRVNMAPGISLPLQRSWGYIEPGLTALYTGYDLTDQLAGLDSSPDTLTGIFSLDSGLFLDRQSSYFGESATHTLEPRLFYLYVPYNSQNDQPVFDTTDLDFNFDNLFRENRYNGSDRIGDANQLTLALNSRFISDKTGRELLRASIGQIYYFRDSKVTLPGGATHKDSTSALVAEVAAELGGNWRARAGLQYDPYDGYDGSIDQALAQLSYRDSNKHIFNAAYRLRDGVISQTDIAAIWPVTSNTSLIGRWNYSLRDDRTLEALAGVEYGRCCWRVRAVARSYTDSDNNENNLAFFLQIELNGLGKLGNDIDELLERGIYGYRED